MNKQDFYFDLPESLIAQYPLQNRSDSRLMVYNKKSKSINHDNFTNLITWLKPGDLLVMNNSKVIPARLYGKKVSGGRVEILVERILEDNKFLAHVKTSKALNSGAIVLLDDQHQIEIIGRNEDLFVCYSEKNTLELLQAIGHIPLPPYIQRSDDIQDTQRYQTVYAKHEGSVAAPTAGLHFDENVLKKLKEKQIEIAYTTLHVGAGTFRPVRCDNILEHKMHAEQFSVGSELCDSVTRTKEQGGRVIAVGTTALRSLESAAKNGQLEPCKGDTDIFIYPGYQFKVCEGLITNFHLPESTLMMLVSAFIGHSETMNLYKEAIEKKYRFFSYGDTSLLI